MKILDWYILKRYLTTFLFTLLILIPIAVAIDISEKVDKFLRHENLTIFEIINDYYKNFIIYYANTFMPLAIFLAVIIFTSRLANNTEIVAINGAQVSFVRMLYPYFIGATLLTCFALFMNHFLVPSSTKTRLRFEKKYFHTENYKDHTVQDFSLQLNDSTFVFLQSFDLKQNTGYNFSLDIYRGLQLKSKLTAENVTWNSKDSTFSLFTWRKRLIYKKRDSLSSGNNIDTLLTFTPSDLKYRSTFAQEMPSVELKEFIKVSQKRGVKNLNSYWVEFYKRTSLPVATYILTLIAVALSSKKKRQGIGMNLALGVAIMFIYVFFLKVAEVLGAVAGANALLYVWMPNIIFGLLSIYLFYNARK